MSGAQTNVVAGAHEATSPQRIALRPHGSLPWLVLPQGIALEVLLDLQPIQMPNTQPWFYGVVSQRGNLLPIFDLALWAGVARDRDAKPYIVSIGKGSADFAIVSETTPALMRLERIEDRPVGLDALAPYVNRTFSGPEGDAYEFDIERWFALAAGNIAKTQQFMR